MTEQELKRWLELDAKKGDWPIPPSTGARSWEEGEDLRKLSHALLNEMMKEWVRSRLNPISSIIGQL